MVQRPHSSSASHPSKSLASTLEGSSTFCSYLSGIHSLWPYPHSAHMVLLQKTLRPSWCFLWRRQGVLARLLLCSASYAYFQGTPEDLMFFYRHLQLGGGLHRVEKELLTYRYHQDCQSFNVKRYTDGKQILQFELFLGPRETIWSLRVAALEEHVLLKWRHFTIWNAGKQGRRLYRSLKPENQAKVHILQEAKPQTMSSPLADNSMYIPCIFACPGGSFMWCGYEENRERSLCLRGEQGERLESLRLSFISHSFV